MEPCYVFFCLYFITSALQENAVTLLWRCRNVLWNTKLSLTVLCYCSFMLNVSFCCSFTLKALIFCSTSWLLLWSSHRNCNVFFISELSFIKRVPQNKSAAIFWRYCRDGAASMSFRRRTPPTSQRGNKVLIARPSPTEWRRGRLQPDFFIKATTVCSAAST